MYLIWWLDQFDCERIGDELPDGVPDYIRREYNSRLGRPGRGRLWVDQRFDLDEIEWHDDKPLSVAAGRAAGIVIDPGDLTFICCLPGFVTTLDLDTPTVLIESVEN